MLRFSVLSSGSKANSTVIQYKDDLYLIDVGLSTRQTELRMRALGFDPAKLKAVLITHEHSDHVYGLATLARKYKLKIYTNEATGSALALSAERPEQFNLFKTGDTFFLDELKVHAFSISHDAVDPVGYTIETDCMRIGFATDLGRVTPLVTEALRGVHALILESNHDTDSLWSCDYPWELKQRIASRHGHLSNREAAELLHEIFHEDLQHVVLGHLSENSNTPDLALETFMKFFSEQGLDLQQKLPSLRCACVKHAMPILEVSKALGGQVTGPSPELLLAVG